MDIDDLLLAYGMEDGRMPEELQREKVMIKVKVGFTGTQIGMSEDQKKKLRRWLSEHDVVEFHHGDCIGADAEAHAIVARLLTSQIVIHPPSDPKKRAFCFELFNTPSRALQLSRRPYLLRNHDIVDATDILIAAPRTDQEELRSGTWSTVRYARRVGKPVVVLGR